jgi:hypothetical protein
VVDQFKKEEATQKEVVLVYFKVRKFPERDEEITRNLIRRGQSPGRYV